MAHYVAVIDLGKTNSKVALVDTARAEEIRVIKQPASILTNTDYPSLDHQAIHAFIISSLKTLIAEHTVNAITVTAHGATAALIDSHGELALPVIDYEYLGVDSLRTAYDLHRAPFSRTGSPSLPGGLNVGAQLYWLQHTYPELFASARAMLTWPQYWIYVLTGERHNDVTSLGCHTDLYEPEKGHYSSLVNAMGWQHLLPSIQRPGQLSGMLRKSIAQQLGLSESLPVHTGIHDSNASLVPHLIAHPAPFSVVSTGTWFIAMAMGGIPTKLDETRDTLINVNALGQSVPSARFMGGRERELLNVSTISCEQTTNNLINSSNPSPSMLMPSKVSGTGPYPKLLSRWLGTTTENNPALRSCALTLYLALMTHECMRLIGSQGPTFIEGPLAHDTLYAQMLTVVSKRPVMVSRSVTGTSVGAAMLVKRPDKLPGYEHVELDSMRRTQLKNYAHLWQKQLQDHAR